MFLLNMAILDGPGGSLFNDQPIDRDFSSAAAIDRADVTT
jgi:hypothetical protein